MKQIIPESSPSHAWIIKQSSSYILYQLLLCKQLWILVKYLVIDLIDLIHWFVDLIDWLMWLIAWLMVWFNLIWLYGFDFIWCIRPSLSDLIVLIDRLIGWLIELIWLIDWWIVPANAETFKKVVGLKKTSGCIFEGMNQTLLVFP